MENTWHAVTDFTHFLSMEKRSDHLTDTAFVSATVPESDDACPAFLQVSSHFSKGETSGNKNQKRGGGTNSLAFS